VTGDQWGSVGAYVCCILNASPPVFSQQNQEVGDGRLNQKLLQLVAETAVTDRGVASLRHDGRSRRERARGAATVGRRFSGCRPPGAVPS
jgi:hypothetical protein